MSREHRRVRPRSVESPLVAVALGLASLGVKLDRFLASSAPPLPSPPRDGERRPLSAADEQGLYFLLGLVAARQRLAGLLDDVAPPSSGAPAGEAPRTAHIDRSLFR